MNAFVRAAETYSLTTRQIDRLLLAAFAHDLAEPPEDPSAALLRYHAILDAKPDPAPELPWYAVLADGLGDDASPWLDRYIAFSRVWSPRAFDAFHEACGLWLLSTVAARRVTLQLGHPRYTSLYLALVARSSVYTKSTAAELALATLRAAGLDWLLAADDSTPQRFLHDLATATPAEAANKRAPRTFGDLRSGRAPGSDDLTARHALRRAFGGQRGWYYEEFGQQLEAMIRERGALSQFRNILKRFDDGRDQYEVTTLARGSERVERPYLALLACMTPADMRPLARFGASVWHDGYLARFAFVTPGNANHSRAPFPSGVRVIPDELVEPLRAWHAQLGVPALLVPPRSFTAADLLNMDFSSADPAAGPSEPGFAAARPAAFAPLPVQQCAADPEVYEAFYRYHNALIELTARAAAPDLDASYARHTEKALRVAMLLASLDNGGRIELRHWARAQAIAERWRSGLHALVAQLNEPPPSARRLMEQRVLDVVQRKGNPTAAEVANYLKNLSTAESQRFLDSLAKAAILDTELTPRGAVRYSFKS